MGETGPSSMSVMLEREVIFRRGTIQSNLMARLKEVFSTEAYSE